MQIYLVGGAVRDQYLGYPSQEKDWVVVGGTVEEMQALGFRQVGKDFPVFLHPQTNEEYALARTERKHAPGYYGFTCDFDKTVRLEDDLARRDLTINAMAIDASGTLIDPYGGMQDLQAKILRHVSPAFREDPVRILRLARFAARYHHLGFRVAEETRCLMAGMVASGEVHALVAERIWQEWQQSLEEKNPELFITTMRACNALAVVLPEIDALFGVPNPQRYHPEIDSGIHSLMTLKAAVVLSTDPVVRFAALLHDLGKAKTPIVEWPNHHGHEHRGQPIIEALCQRLRVPSRYAQLAGLVCRHHLTMHRLDELRPATLVSLLEKVDYFRRKDPFNAMLLACRADLQGRMGEKDLRFWTEKWGRIAACCATISAKEVIAKGYQGKAIKEQLHAERVAAVQSLLDQEPDERQ